MVEDFRLIKLNEELHDPTSYHAFEEISPRDHPKNSRFAINFLLFIGLSGLTLDVRKFLKKKKADRKRDDWGRRLHDSEKEEDDRSRRHEEETEGKRRQHGDEED